MYAAKWLESGRSIQAGTLVGSAEVRAFARLIYRALPESLRFRTLALHVRVGSPFGPIGDANQQALFELHPFDLVIHVGAHRGQEAPAYSALGAKTIVWVEADPAIFADLANSLPSKRKVRHVCVQAAVSDEDGRQLYLRQFSNDGASNSLHEPTKLLFTTWTFLAETGPPIPVKTKTLETTLREAQIVIDCRQRNLLVLDVQGHELKVLQGTPKDLIQCFDAIVCEISTAQIYDGAATHDEILRLLDAMGFQPKTALPALHGDVVFCKG